MELCVLEDKLRRLLVLVSNTPARTTTANKPPAFDAAVVRELLEERVWSPSEHPYWLALEVDGDLQIRPVQYILAQMMIEHPGHIMQLNMGEGKTRVILPMLMLYWTMARKAQVHRAEHPIVRVTMLAQLLTEGFEHLHWVLCAGILNRRLSTIPFDRRVELCETRLETLLSHARYCQDEGVAVFVTPESRCSLQLKWHELRGEGQMEMCKLLRAFEELRWKDVIDESD